MPGPPTLACRLCGSTALESFVDLGATPPCELFLTAEALEAPEATFPLHPRVCRACLLVQLPPLIDPDETFSEYAYFSSFSTSWVEHARRFVTAATEKAGLTADSFVVEVASNDGYLLQHVVADGVGCLGIEPSVNVGQAARDIGVPTRTDFLDEPVAAQVRAERGPANLVVANNVYAHIPDVLGFTRSLRTLLADDGWLSIEVHHALNLVREAQFDTIYHEHFQYYTVITAQRALASGGLRLVDVELLDTHGGSIRLWARPEELDAPEAPAVEEVMATEAAAGLDTVAIRVPAHRAIRALLTACGRPLAAPSANASNALSPTRASHVAASLAPRVPLIVDDGPCADGIESTIVHGGAILRPGPIAAEALAAVLGGIAPAPQTDRPSAPGQLATHYAPAKPLRLEATDRRRHEYLIGFGPVAGDATLSAAGDLVEAAARLFDALHLADASPLPSIAVAPVPSGGLGAAINDRLARAAHREGEAPC